MHRPLAVALALLVLPLTGCWGVAFRADHQGSVNAAASLGAQTCRVEFSASASTSSMEDRVGDVMDVGCKPYLLASFANQNLPTSAEATNLANWADHFGPGGAFMTGRNGSLAVNTIEFGNESSYRNGAPDGPGPGDDWWASQSYLDRACNYGVRAAQAVFAINQANNEVDLAVQADHGGSGSPNWVNTMLSASCGPGLKTTAGSWTVHPYGPTPQNKVNAVISQTAAAGADSDISIDVTEYGPSSVNGAYNVTPDNYGWPTNLTYAQAATALQDGGDLIENAAGSRLRYIFIFATHDTQAVGASTSREPYFGCLQNDLEEKGAYSTKCRDLLDNE